MNRSVAVQSSLIWFVHSSGIHYAWSIENSFTKTNHQTDPLAHLTSYGTDGCTCLSVTSVLLSSAQNSLKHLVSCLVLFQELQHCCCSFSCLIQSLTSTLSLSTALFHIGSSHSSRTAASSLSSSSDSGYVHPSAPSLSLRVCQ